MRPWLMAGAMFVVTGCTPEAGVKAARMAIFAGTPDTTDTSVVMLSIKTPKGVGTCSGSVVSPHVVLTAAHCIHPDIVGNNPTVKVFTGDDTAGVAANDPRWLEVAEAQANPFYTTQFISPSYDVGVVITAQAMSQTPLKMNDAPLAEDLIGKPVRIVGYGLTDPKNPGNTDARRQGQSTIEEITENWITFQTGKQLVCPGDSGGPMLLSRDGGEVIIGVNSTEADLANCGGPAHDARIDVFRDFVDPFIAQHDPPQPDMAGGGIPDTVPSEGCQIGAGRDHPGALAVMLLALGAVARVRRRQEAAQAPSCP